MKQSVNENFILGILGGMGPLAGVELQKKIIKLSPAKRDQEHLKMVCFTNPHVSDRTNCLEQGEDFSVSIANSLNRLKTFGADIGVIACNTAHAQIEDIQNLSDLPLMNIIKETVGYIMTTFPDAKKIGLLATNGTIKSGAYHKCFYDHGLTEILPDSEMQEIAMELIYSETGLKSGFVDNRLNVFVLDSLIENLIVRGADIVILGCTEFSMLKINRQKTIDPLNIAARKIIEMAYQKKAQKDLFCQTD